MSDDLRAIFEADQRMSETGSRTGPRRFLALPALPQRDMGRTFRVVERQPNGLSKPIGPHFRRADDARAAADEMEQIRQERSLAAAREHLRLHPNRIKEWRTYRFRYDAVTDALRAVERLEAAGFRCWKLDALTTVWSPEHDGYRLLVESLDEDKHAIRRLAQAK